LFDFLSGVRSRAPSTMQKAGLEWAYRMALEPKRLGWRYATTNVTAALAMARNSHGPI
jgi:exopolysaccharide biosynthesis WecB/TagA/CpsF family protein